MDFFECESDGKYLSRSNYFNLFVIFFDGSFRTLALIEIDQEKHMMLVKNVNVRLL